MSRAAPSRLWRTSSSHTSAPLFVLEPEDWFRYPPAADFWGRVGTERMGSLSINRRDLLGLAALAASGLGSPRALAQAGRQPLVAAMIGAASPTDPAGVEWADAIIRGLSLNGWVVGENVAMEPRFTAGDPSLIEHYATELLELVPDVFVTGTSLNALAVRRHTQSIPVVFVAVTDPVAEGLVAQIPRPGGVTTGVTHFEPSQGGKFVDLLFDVAPATALVVSLTNPAGSTFPAAMKPFIAKAAAAHGAAFEEVFVHSVEEIGPAVDAIGANRGAGIVLPSNNWVHNNADPFIEAIARNRIPAVYSSVRMVVAGGLVGLGVDTTQSFLWAGDYAGRILHGTDPGSLPVLSPGFILVVNQRTARTQGIDIPITLLAIADQVVE